MTGRGFGGLDEGVEPGATDAGARPESSRPFGAKSAVNRGVPLPIVFLVDVSNSMNLPAVAGAAEVASADAESGRGEPTRLEVVLSTLDRARIELLRVGDVRRGGEVAVIAFGNGGVSPLDVRRSEARSDPLPTFVNLVDSDFEQDLHAGGATPLADALAEADRLLRERSTELRGRPRYRSILFLITDGENTDEVTGHRVPIAASAIDALREQEQDRKLLLFSVALPGANLDELRRLTPDSTYAVDAVAFDELVELIVVSSTEVVSGGNGPADDIYQRINEVMARW